MGLKETQKENWRKRVKKKRKRIQNERVNARIRQWEKKGKHCEEIGRWWKIWLSVVYPCQHSHKKRRKQKVKKKKYQRLKSTARNAQSCLFATNEDKFNYKVKRFNQVALQIIDRQEKEKKKEKKSKIQSEIKCCI